jgi:hypothetical protein
VWQFTYFYEDLITIKLDLELQSYSRIIFPHFYRRETERVQDLCKAHASRAGLGLCYPNFVFSLSP